jgi:hypothetical protein
MIDVMLSLQQALCRPVERRPGAPRCRREKASHRLFIVEFARARRVGFALTDVFETETRDHYAARTVSHRNVPPLYEKAANPEHLAR